MNVFRKIIMSIKEYNRPVLSDRTILKYNKQHLLIFSTIRPEQVQPNSVDLTLADGYKTLVGNCQPTSVTLHTDATNIYDDVSLVIDPKYPIRYNEYPFITDKEKSDKEYTIIYPGEFRLMASREILNIPNGIIAFVQGRSSIARLGIQTEQAGLIDAGFRGTITFEVYNQTKHPIILYEGMRVAQVYFFKAQYASKTYGIISKGSKYQGQIEPTGSMLNNDPELKGV